eukprot:Selendium_serpulae@DN5163_c0_g1_i1.p1
MVLVTIMQKQRGNLKHVSNIFKRKPYPLNMLSSAIILLMGDTASQSIEHYVPRRTSDSFVNSKAARPAETSNLLPSWFDPSRARKMFCVGLLCNGPLYTWWYNGRLQTLSSLVWSTLAKNRQVVRRFTSSLRGLPVSQAIKKVEHVKREDIKLRRHFLMLSAAVDCLIFNAFYTGFFFVATELASMRSNLQGIIAKLRQEWLPTYCMGAAVWWPVQYLNFAFVPQHCVPLAVNCCNFCWAIVLSWRANAPTAARD